MAVDRDIKFLGFVFVQWIWCIVVGAFEATQIAVICSPAFLYGQTPHVQLTPLGHVPANGFH